MKMTCLSFGEISLELNPMIPNLLGSNNQIATLGNNGGFFAGHGVLFAKKPFFSVGDNVAPVPAAAAWSTMK